jgi:hypothetical protein
MSKAIYFAGVSRVAGELKFRTAASPARFQQLSKLGDTDVEMVNVNVETKSQAAKELLARNFANGRADIEALLVSVANDDNPFAKPKVAKKPRTVKAKNVIVKKSAPEKFDWDVKMSPKEAARVRAQFMKKLKEVYDAN